jgi:adenosylcobinamide-GDP ribazoletransferase
MSTVKQRVSPFTGLALAIQFLTVLPVRRSRASKTAKLDEPPDMAQALPWFPLVGAMLGLALVVLDWALAFVFPTGIRAVALLAFIALVTGMLHFDGFVDCCDALLGNRPVARRLEILRDSRIGAYGAIGGALLLLAYFAALVALDGPPRVVALLAAPTLGRWSIVYAVTRYPYARGVGAGTPFRSRGAGHLVVASISMLLLLAGNTFAASSRWQTIAVMAVLTGMLLMVAQVTLLVWLAWAARRLGGKLTGDTYGAVCVLVELVVLLLAPPLAALAAQLVGG